MSTSEATSRYPTSDIPVSVRETFTSQHHIRVLSSGVFSHDDLHFAFKILKQYVAYNTPNKPFIYVSLYQDFKAISARARQLRTEHGFDIQFHAWGWSSKSAEEAAKQGHISEYNLDSAFEDIAHYLDVLSVDKGFQLYAAVMMHAILRCGEMLTCIKDEFEVSNRLLEREAEVRREQVGRLRNMLAVAEDLRNVLSRQVDDWRRQALAFRFRFLMFRRLWNIGGPG